MPQENQRFPLLFCPTTRLASRYSLPWVVDISGQFNEIGSSEKLTYTKSYTKSNMAKQKKHSLFRHASGQWARKVKLGGVWKTRYFGVDEDRAVERYLEEKEYLDAGILPPPKDSLSYASVEYVAESFIQSKQTMADAGRIQHRTLIDWTIFAKLAVGVLGRGTPVDRLGPADFDRLAVAIGEKWGPTRSLNATRVIRSIFKSAFDNGFIDRPVRFGNNFNGPSKREFRLHRASQGERMLEPAQLRSLILGAAGALRPSILLGLNCAFLPVDVVSFRSEFVRDGWLTMPRSKTGTMRRCHLWTETLEAIASVPVPFQSRRGNALTTTALSQLFKNAVDAVGLYRAGINFAMLRHVHQTIGEQSGDSLAVKLTMGHADGTISEVYRERFPDDRLRAVSETIRQWLFSAE